MRRKITPCFFKAPVNILTILVLFLMEVVTVSGQNINFSTSTLKGISLTNPTSLQFGPDSRLYVSQQNGLVKIFTVKRNGAGDYHSTATETISLINQIPNHNDDGTPNTGVNTRQITSLLVTGTADAPVLYVTSSDSRIGGPSGDLNLDTNSGILSRLTKTAQGWDKVDLVRGFPRSEENHSTNGMQLDEKTNMLYLAVGGFTNAGAPSNNFAFITEYALSAAILSVDLNQINAMPVKGSGNTRYIYDLPTVDDPTRANNADGSDLYDPFGGNDGLNQARIVPGGPVQIFSPGYRNAYDLVITRTPGKAGRIYTVDNGPNQGWGGGPDKEGNDGTVTNKYVNGEPGSSGPGINDPQVNNLDGFHYIGNLDSYIPGSYYGGHPNPIRANPQGAGLYTRTGSTGVWRSEKNGSNPLPADWPPVPAASPIEGDYQSPGEADGSLMTFPTSTNGLVEYTASNFNNALKGTLLAACYNGSIYKITLNEEGTRVTNKTGGKKLIQDAPFASNFGSQPLDITAQGDGEIFPGTVWAATYGADAVTIFEPADLASCSGKYSASLDEDGDGYSNADEIDNGTLPCSASSKPADFDGDKISDLNDPDDDNDGIPDSTDYFARDADNGTKTNLPVMYDLFNNDPGTGFFGLGFTGLMSNKKADNDYGKLYNEDNLIAGGAVGAFSVVDVSSGDAMGNKNDQENAFQFGVKVSPSTGPFTVKGRILGNYFNNKTPKNDQSQGMYIGTGDQDNYIKITLNSNDGKGGIQVVQETAGKATSFQFSIANALAAPNIDLFLSVDPAAGKVQPKYAVNGGAVVNAGNPLTVSGELLETLQGTHALAVGIISTSDKAQSFTATWDYINVTQDAVQSGGSWQTLASASGTPIGREENAYVQAGQKFYLLGGRGIKAVQEYDPIKKTWTNKSNVPMELHHFQAVVLDGLIYVAGALTGTYPREKPVPNIYIYNPASDKWTKGAAIPAARQRGSSGVVVYNKKIYLVAGILDGHWAGHVKWFDEYNPATNAWTILPDAPQARDHFHAAMIGTKIYVAGGRRSSASTGQTFSLTVKEVDIYDFTTGKWTTLPAASNIPTARAGAGTVALGNELIVIGGESPQPAGHKETEALNVTTNTWRRLADLVQGRHGTQAIENNGSIYIVTGAGNQGGSPLLTTQELFYFNAPASPTGTALAQSTLSAPGVNFGSVAISSSHTMNLVISNTTGNQAIILTAISKTGDASFSYTSPVTLPITIPVGATLSFPVVFKPVSAGNKSGAMVFANSGSNAVLTVPLNGSAAAGGSAPTSYQINAGGPALTLENKSWLADNYFVGGKVYTNASVGDIANTNSDQLYKTERSSATTFAYAFPLASGKYKVDLHFAEIYWGATGGGAGGAGKRVFTVNLEGGTPELPNYDIFADVGAMKAVVKTFYIDVVDGTLNIDFSATKDQPKISAIAISPTSSVVSMSSSPESLHFFSQQAGSTSASQTVMIKNTGNTSAVISSVNITGANSTEFAHNYAGSNTVAVGASKSIGVTFKPASLGTKVAQLVISYSGSSVPVTVNLTGEGTENPNQAPVANAGLDKTVNLPGTLKLEGSGTDPDGSVASYKWHQVSGPSTAFFSSDTAQQPTLSGLVVGTYVFGLVVTDNLGLSSPVDEVTVSVKQVNDLGQILAGFILIDATSDKEIGPLQDGTVLNLNALPKNLNVRAITSPDPVGSVVFKLTGAFNYDRTESEAPYAMYGDTKGEYRNWVPALGSYTLVATPFTLAGGKGVAGVGLTVHFTAVRQAVTTQNHRTGLEANEFAFETDQDGEEFYPNPATERVHIRVHDAKLVRKVTMNNLSGQAVYISEKESEWSSGIPVKGMSAGLYLIRLQMSDSREVTRRIVISK